MRGRTALQEYKLRSIDHLLDQNKVWAEEMQKSDPEYFTRIARQQEPKCATPFHSPRPVNSRRFTQIPLSFA